MADALDIMNAAAAAAQAQQNEWANQSTGKRACPSCGMTQQGMDQEVPQEEIQQQLGSRDAQAAAALAKKNRPTRAQQMKSLETGSSE